MEAPAVTEQDLAGDADKLLSSTGGARNCWFATSGPGARARPARSRRGPRDQLKPGPGFTTSSAEFDPNDQQAGRLGPNINPAKILALAGNTRRGRKIFHEDGRRSLRPNATTCGRAGGGGFGPDMTHIAAKYNRADLLDNILNPSKTIAQGFASYVVRTTSGDVFTGILVKQNDQEVVLKDVTLKLTRIPAADAEKVTAQPISAMPDGLLNDLTGWQAASA